MRSLAEGFAYDAWASARWELAMRESVQGEDRVGKLAKIQAHIDRAKTTWLDRVNEAKSTSFADWHEAVAAIDPDAEIGYKNFSGDYFASSFAQIAWHVVNHGTYHRGQMRQIAESEGIPWPETDLIFYYRESA